jgi:hypothetical protein
MTTNPTATDSRLQAAIDELQGLILARYPEATFSVSPAEDDPRITHLVTTIDIDDTEEVIDLVIERMLQLQVEDGLPIYVVPVRPFSRILARRAALASQAANQ